MNAQVSLLGLYQPGEGWLFRAGVGWKYLIMLALSIPALVLQQWPLTVSSLMATVLLLFSSGIGLVRALRIGWVMWLLLAALTAYHLVVLNPGAAVVQPGNLLLAILAARLLTLTTSTPELLSALASALRPLRFIGLKPDSIALMVALMIRSIPYLIGLFGDSQDAARAAGLNATRWRCWFRWCWARLLMRNAPARLLLLVVLGNVDTLSTTASLPVGTG